MKLAINDTTYTATSSSLHLGIHQEIDLNAV